MQTRAPSEWPELFGNPLLASAGLDRLAHHAEGAASEEAVLKFAPEAAREAAAKGAHRQAAQQFARALRFATAPTAQHIYASPGGLPTNGGGVEQIIDVSDPNKPKIVGTFGISMFDSMA